MNPIKKKELSIKKKTEMDEVLIDKDVNDLELLFRYKRITEMDEVLIDKDVKE